MKGWHGVQVPLTAARSTLTLTVILNPPSRLHPPRLTLTLGLTGPWRVRGRATLTRRAARPWPSRPAGGGLVAEGPRTMCSRASRPRGRGGLGSAACDPRYGKAAWRHVLALERESH